MSTLGYVILGVFSAISITILLTFFLSPVARKIGVRNISRRLGNTSLVVLGSMVGAALVSGSLVLSDSLDKTFSNIVQEQLGEVDASINIEEEEFIPGLPVHISRENFLQVREQLDVEDIDGVLPTFFIITAPQKIDLQGKPVLNVYGVEVYGTTSEDLKFFGQNPQILPQPDSYNGAYITETLSKRLEVKEGDLIRIPYGEVSMEVLIEKVYKDEGILGGSRILLTNEFLTSQIGLPDNSYNSIYISAKGGIEPEDYDGETFEKKVDELLDEVDIKGIRFQTSELKQDALDGYGLGFFADMFLVLSFFGIFAGILLIVNIYMMLAAERKTEMGILRAIALSRGQLTRIFVYEGFFYSLISSLIGTLIGLGIGYTLVFTLKSIFKTLFESFGEDESLFKIVFDYNVSSLIIAFAAGATITLITSILSSYRISKLNIVSAIRNLPDVEQIKPGPGWLLVCLLLPIILPLRLLAILISIFGNGSTIVYRIMFFISRIKNRETLNKAIGWAIILNLSALMFLSGSFSLVFSFGAKDYFEKSREEAISQGTETYFSELSDSNFESQVTVIQAYSFYVGAILAIFFGSVVLNKITKDIFKLNLTRGLVILASSISIALTALITRIDFIADSFEEDASIGLFFFSGIVLVVASSMIFTYNLELVTQVFGVLFTPIGRIRSAVKIALRYPSVSPARTGMTLVMFALVIFLIAYISMVKVTINQQNEKTVEKALGGFDVLILPSIDLKTNQVENINAELSNYEEIEEVAQITYTFVSLPDYVYKDLDEAPVFGPPIEYEEDDSFKTQLEGLPGEFIRKMDIELGEYSDNYESENEVWEAVISDPSKVVLGAAFIDDGYGKRPELQVGDKIKVADVFGNVIEEKEIIGMVPRSPNQGFNISFYTNIITSKEHVEAQVNPLYLEKFSSRNVLVDIKNDGINASEVVKDIKKALIDYNIIYIFELTEITKQTQAFMDSIIAMMQGFLAFSLVVGTSGLAIIMARSVQERKQQIGMLRSLGFRRWMVLLSFFLESTFISLLGIIIGVSMGTIGALNAFYAAFKDQPDVKPIFPVGEIALICILVYIASIIFSLLPSIKASRLSPVEATSYPQ